MNSRKYNWVYILLCTIVLTGCWGHQEINEVILVQTTGIDKGKNNKVKLTIEFLKITGSSQGPSGLMGKKLYLSQDGDTLFEAARKLREKSSRSVFWGHSSVIIFGKDVAEEGLKKQVDILYRQRHFRQSALIFVASGSAEEIIKSKVVQENLVSTSLKGLMKSQNLTSTIKKTTLQTVYSDLVNEYRELTIPAIFINSKTEKGLLKTTGLYGFRNDRLVSFIDASFTKQYLRLINEAKSAVETLNEGKGKFITFENLNSHTNIEPSLSQGKPAISIEIFANFNIADVHGDFNEITPAKIASWEKKLNQKIKKEVEEFLDYTKTENLDLIGIGESIHRKYPERWKKINKDWKNLYPKLDYSIEVKSSINHTYLLNDSL
ncbi:Ger(x)C family spore germination protein [Cytobacillus dafuensis]|uniref:Ger(X)C family spore germination protein n=1 Tax=Cytobacillus dafuensis TaxID=1742359 RepID=A0A5B8Z570_CYTDA|nr:Ger(x)C family spore germination protein [Cytobacillus dafuensis]QED48225.1 Ger(x)C family spore germination protein [Cytobacillus dafuensis]